MITQNVDPNDLPFSLMQGKYLVAAIKPDKKTYIFEYILSEGLKIILSIIAIMIGF